MSILTLAVKSIDQLNDSTEVGSDEPFVLVTAVNLSDIVPQLEVVRYGPLENEGTFRHQLFWGLDNKHAAVITDPNDVVFIVSLMEKDDGNLAVSRIIVKMAAIGSLIGSMGMPRSTRVQNLIKDIRFAMGIRTGIPSADDSVGVHELILTPTDLTPSASKKRIRSIDFHGGKEGSFRVNIELNFE
ncbi:MAG TPA: hypothetical protein VIN08_19685 [Ohtaekwangia sp.]|uniref:hypothetical protein n=1 Tax=Ohtaekwangia sp. TaxID=2066019 RepID=UPI002F94C505